MSDFPINGLDLAVIIILLVSALLAFIRGFVQETLSIGAWIGAAFGALYGLQFAQPVARSMISLDWAADAVTVVALFLGILFVLSLLTNYITHHIHRSALNPLDRSLGFLFGLIRGLIILAVAVIITNWLIKPVDRPQWIETAKTMPFLDTGADLLKALVPDSFQQAEFTAKEAATKVNEAAEMKRTFDRLTVPTPSSKRDKDEKVGDKKEAPAKDTDAAPAPAEIEDLIGQKMRELESINNPQGGGAR